MNTWERVTAAIAAATILLLVVFLVIRNQPFNDPNLVVLTRIVLSLAIAVFGATVPGFLNVDWSLNGMVVRAGGALALFVLSFIATPHVITPLNGPDPVSQQRYNQ